MSVDAPFCAAVGRTRSPQVLRMSPVSVTPESVSFLPRFRRTDFFYQRSEVRMIERETYGALTYDVFAFRYVNGPVGPYYVVSKDGDEFARLLSFNGWPVSYTDPLKLESRLHRGIRSAARRVHARPRLATIGFAVLVFLETRLRGWSMSSALTAGIIAAVLIGTALVLAARAGRNRYARSRVSTRRMRSENGRQSERRDSQR